MSEFSDVAVPFLSLSLSVSAKNFSVLESMKVLNLKTITDFPLQDDPLEESYINLAFTGNSHGVDLVFLAFDNVQMCVKVPGWRLQDQFSQWLKT